MHNINHKPLGADFIAEDLPALLLVGGMGTRLRSVLSSKPKPLAPVGDIPFLELLVLQLRSQGIRHLVMCTGYQAEQVREEFGDGHRWGVGIEYSNEPLPLGTAGAIKFAEQFLAPACDFLVMNGDSFLQFDFREFHRFHRKHGGLASIAVRSVPDASRYGTVHLDRGNRVVRFSEKMGIQEPGLINGGVYLFQRAILEHIPEGDRKDRPALKRMYYRVFFETGLLPCSRMECLLISERPRTMRVPKLFSTAFLKRLFSTLKPCPIRSNAPSPEGRK